MSTSCSSATSAIPRRLTRRPAGRLLPGRPRTQPIHAVAPGRSRCTRRAPASDVAGRHCRLQSRRIDSPVRPSRGAARSARLSRSDRRSVAGAAVAWPDRRMTLKQLPASIVSGPAAAGAANAFEAIDRLREIYCSTTGHDYNHVFVPDERVWLRQAVESGQFRAADGSDQRRRAARSHHAGRDLRALPAPHLPGQDALLDRGPRHDGPDPRRDHSRCRRGRRAARDDRDGASRPPERARAHPAEAVLADSRRVQGSDPRQSPARRPRLDGRREVSRRRAHRGAARRPAEAGHHLDAAEPEPPRSGRSGAERHGARRGDDRGPARRRRSSTRARSCRS